MIDEEGLDLEPALVVDGDRLFRPGLRDVVADHARALGRHQLVALGDAELGVGVIGLGEALDHGLGAGGAEGLALGVGGALSPSGGAAGHRH